MHRALTLVALGLLLSAGIVYQRGRGTPEDSIIVHFQDAPAVGVPQVGYVAPDDGRLLFLFATGHTAGVGAGAATFAAVRADGGVACSIDIPCTLSTGEHVPNDGGVAECSGAEFAFLERLEFEATSTCASQPDFFLQASFKLD